MKKITLRLTDEVYDQLRKEYGGWIQQGAGYTSFSAFLIELLTQRAST
jgi:predicted CopG family antitoxin